MKKRLLLLTLLIFASVKSNAQWVEVEPPVSNQFANCLLSKDGKLYVGMNSGVYSSNNNGDSWDDTHSTDVNTGMAIKFMISTANNIYAAGVSGGSGTYVNPIKYNGTSWVADTIGLPQRETQAFFTDGNRLFIAFIGNTSLSMYTKLESETSWTAVSSIGVTSNPSIWNAVYTIYKVNTTYYIITGGYNKVWSSTDGINFTESSSTIPQEATCAYSDASAAYIGTKAGLYKTTDGSTFTRIDSGFPMYASVLGPGVQYVYVSGTDIYASSKWVDAINQSTTGTISWTDITSSSSIIEAQINSVVSHNGALFATQQVWEAAKAPIVRYGTPTTTGISNSNKKATFGVYPNPSSEFITVNNVPSGSTLNILDITGKVVYTSVVTNDQITINTSELINGMYLIRLDNNGQSTSKQLIVNK
ncbi:MAG: T9SS type A sorting domain-containing protein [Cytophagaceae bacterium]